MAKKRKLNNGLKTWLNALKEWNSKQNGKWTIPKKGTKGYTEVKALMK